MNHFVSDHQIYQDLHVLEERALLAPGAAVIADNVLKPGAPRFLWKLRSKRRGNRSGEIYHAQILSLQVRSFCCVSGKVFCICRSKNKLPSIWNLLTWMVELFFLGGKVGIVSFQGSRIHLISCVFFDGCKEGSTLSQWFNVFLKRCIFRSVWLICVFVNWIWKIASLNMTSIVQEFAMPSEDWMTVSIRIPSHNSDDSESMQVAACCKVCP